MPQTSTEFCLSAVAYIKIEAPPSEGPAIELSEDDSPVLRPLGHGLLATYLVDEGGSFAYVQHRHLAEAGLSKEELHASAIRNLTSLAAEQAEVRSFGNIYAVLMGGIFEASLVLVDEFWMEWFSHLAPNGFAVAFPARDILAFGDIASPEAINGLHQVCQRVQGETDHLLSNALYHRADATWLPMLHQPFPEAGAGKRGVIPDSSAS